MNSLYSCIQSREIRETLQTPKRLQMWYCIRAVPYKAKGNSAFHMVNLDGNILFQQYQQQSFPQANSENGIIPDRLLVFFVRYTWETWQQMETCITFSSKCEANKMENYTNNTNIHLVVSFSSETSGSSPNFQDLLKGIMDLWPLTFLVWVSANIFICINIFCKSTD